MNFEVLVLAINNDALQWCRQNGLLHVNRFCPACQCEMSLVKDKCSDGFIWQCGRPCRRRLSIRSGTFFEGSKLTIRQIVYLIYWWVYECTSVNFIEREILIASPNTGKL